MNATATPSNRHIVDQLADVRAKIKDLESVEKDLRERVRTAMGSGDSLGGDEFIARQTLSTCKGSVDNKAVKAAGIDLDKFRKADTVVYALRLERRVAEEG
jgi:hypothetical protein